MDTVKITLPIETGMLMHDVPGKIALKAKAMGLNVTHDKTGGWFERSHLLIITGDDVDTGKRFWKWLQLAYPELNLPDV